MLPPKRPYRMAARAENVAATGERLLAAAWRHFASRPYEDVRLHEIAAEANVTVQTLHNRFRSKEELFTAAFMWWGAEEISQRDTAPVGERPRGDQSALRALRGTRRGDPAVPLPRGAHTRRPPDDRRRPRLPPPLGAANLCAAADGQQGAARQRRLTAIAAATDLLVWKLLRRDMQLDRGDAEAVVIEMIDGPAEALD